MTIDQSAFNALDLYIDRLRGQGLAPDPGGEDGGAAARPDRAELIRR